MVARSAYVHTPPSPLLLAGSLLGMGFLFAPADPCPFLRPRAVAWIAWLLMMATFEPATRRFGYSLPARALSCLALPAIALFYLAATVGSALAHHFGRGVVWMPAPTPRARHDRIVELVRAKIAATRTSPSAPR